MELWRKSDTILKKKSLNVEVKLEIVLKNTIKIRFMCNLLPLSCYFYIEGGNICPPKICNLDDEMDKTINSMTNLLENVSILF